MKITHESGIRILCLFLAFFLIATGMQAYADTDIPTYGIYPFENIHELKKLSWNMNIYTATQALTIPYEIENNDDGTNRVYAFPENNEIVFNGIICDGIVLDFNTNDRLIGIGYSSQMRKLEKWSIPCVASMEHQYNTMMVITGTQNITK